MGNHDLDRTEDLIIDKEIQKQDNTCLYYKTRNKKNQAV